MSKIKVLDSLTANKIAAGEIVEGPASVVKELLENSLDAQADNIEIEIKEGGLSLIRITDNGHGMGGEDAILAFQRYATSKIRASEDLFKIITFGFRGEALPAIAGVSLVTLTTKQEHMELGWQVKLAGGELQSTEEMAFLTGTSLEVRNLFYNTPARRKFLRSASYQSGQITELITKYSLGHPKVRFKLIANQRVIYDTQELNNTELRLSNIYGEEMGRQFLHVGLHEYINFSIEAWLAPGSFNRNNRSQQTFFVNGRIVKSKELAGILEEAYHTFLPKGRFPVAVLNLQIDTNYLDVNIHPAKLEIKIFNIQKIQEKLVELFKEKLSAQKITNYQQIGQKENIRKEIGKDNLDVRNSLENNYDQMSILEEPNFISFATSRKETQTKTNEVGIHIKNILALTFIGQLNNSFILAQNKNALLIIDQHTAHERILYEKYFKEAEQQKIIQENLLLPITLNLTGQQEGILMKNIILFNDLGFVLENFGPGTYLLRSLPLGLKVENTEGFFYDLLEDLENSKQLTIAKIKEKIIISAACRGAVKANQRLTNEDIEYLFRELSQVENPHTCPHGRPIIHQITMQELYTIFQRGLFPG